MSIGVMFADKEIAGHHSLLQPLPRINNTAARHPFPAYDRGPQPETMLSDGEQFPLQQRRKLSRPKMQK
jgi:hypothetical protein